MFFVIFLCSNLKKTLSKPLDCFVFRAAFIRRLLAFERFNWIKQISSTLTISKSIQRLNISGLYVKTPYFKQYSKCLSYHFEHVLGNICIEQITKVIDVNLFYYAILYSKD